VRAAALVLLAACASAPAPKPAVRAADPVRLVLRALRAPPEDRALAGDVDGQLCAAASQDPAYQVVCAADVQAAAEVGQMRAAFGQCDDPSSNCVDQVQNLATGEQALSGELGRTGSGYTLTLVRASAGGEILRRVVRSSPDPAALQEQVPGALAETLR
jgi:hypothetical protein